MMPNDEKLDVFFLLWGTRPGFPFSKLFNPHNVGSPHQYNKTRKRNKMYTY